MILHYLSAGKTCNNFQLIFFCIFMFSLKFSVWIKTQLSSLVHINEKSQLFKIAQIFIYLLAQFSFAKRTSYLFINCLTFVFFRKQVYAFKRVIKGYGFLEKRTSFVKKVVFFLIGTILMKLIICM